MTWRENIELLAGRLSLEPTPRDLEDAVNLLLALVAQMEELEATVTAIAEQQPKTLAMIKHNGFVFDSIGHEPGNWQHLAFSIYTDLCEVDTLARAALAQSDPPDDG